MLKGKKGVVLGVANKRSIAWSIGEKLSAAGASIIFNYQDERLEERVKELVKTLPDGLALPCNIADDVQIANFFNQVKEKFGEIDFLVHCIAFANRDELQGQYAATSRAGFAMALDISAYSLVTVSNQAQALMKNGGSIVALTYLGAVRVIPNYNVMGVAKAALESSVLYLANDLGPKAIRVNAISAGPVNTLAARGISGFNAMMDQVRQKAPLRRDTDLEEIADTAVFLCSNMGRGLTGNVLYVDAGYHIMGM